MKKVICFVRVSTLAQSFDEQKEAVIKEIIRDGYTEDEIEVVQGKESAIKLSEEQRETLNEMKDVIETNSNIEAVYLFAIDRLARRVSIVLDVVDYLTRKKVNLVFLNPRKLETLDKNKKEDPLCKIMLMFLAYGAEMEMKIKKARFETSKSKMREEGKLTQGRPLFGYKLDENGYMVCDEEYSAPIIRNIFHDYVEGDYSLKTLYDKYVSLGVFKENNKIAASTKIRTILFNESYSGGECTIRKHKHNIIYPQIIDKELQKKAIEKCKQNRTKPKSSTKYVYLGKGLLRCGDCGRSMVPHTSNVQYQCSGFGHNNVINANVIDTILYEEILLKYSLYLNIKNDDKEKEMQAQIEESNKIIEEKQKQIEDLKIKEDRAFAPYEKGLITLEKFEETIKTYRKKIEKLNKEINEISNSLGSVKYLLEKQKSKGIIQSTNLWVISDPKQLHEMCKELIDYVEVKKNNGENIYIPDGHMMIKIHWKFKMFSSDNKIFEYYYDSKYHIQEWKFDENGELKDMNDISNRIMIRFVRKTKGNDGILPNPFEERRKILIESYGSDSPDILELESITK